LGIRWKADEYKYLDLLSALTLAFKTITRLKKMKQKIPLFAVLCLIILKTFGQTDPNNVPKPPTEQLKIFAPYFGKYKQTMNYAGIKWRGTMEVKPIIKGWYVDWTILTKSEDNRIDREYHLLVTWDSALNKYCTWRFETLPHNNNEITLSTDGADIILEMKLPPLEPSGKAEIFYNRYSKPSNNEIKIVSEIHSSDGKVTEQIGITTATKIK
jgi:hypothetical protein